MLIEDLFLVSVKLHCCCTETVLMYTAWYYSKQRDRMQYLQRTGHYHPKILFSCGLKKNRLQIRPTFMLQKKRQTKICHSLLLFVTNCTLVEPLLMKVLQLFVDKKWLWTGLKLWLFGFWLSYVTGRVKKICWVWVAAVKNKLLCLVIEIVWVFLSLIEVNFVAN